MQPCLKIPEVLSMIFEAAFNPMIETGQANDFLTVLASALTCHSFLEPALDVLWEEQPDLTALLRCFPTEVYSGENEVRISQFVHC